MSEYQIHFPKYELERIAKLSFIASMGFCEYIEVIGSRIRDQLITPRKFYGIDNLIDEINFSFDREKTITYDNGNETTSKENNELSVKPVSNPTQRYFAHGKILFDRICGLEITHLHSHPSEDGFSEGDLKNSNPLYLIKCPSWYKLGCEAFGTNRLNDEQASHMFSSAISYTQKNLHILPKIIQKYEEEIAKAPDFMIKAALGLAAGILPDDVNLIQGPRILRGPSKLIPEGPQMNRPPSTCF